MDLLASFGVGSIAGLINIIVKGWGAYNDAQSRRDKDYLEIAKMRMELWKMRMEVLAASPWLMFSEIFARAWFTIIPTLVLIGVTWYSALHPDQPLWFPDENDGNGFSILGFEIFSYKGSVKWSQLQGTVIFPIWFAMLCM